MSDNVQSAMFEILKSVQTSIARLERSVTELERGQVELQRGQVELKDFILKQRRDVAGILVMMKSVAGDFDQRVSAAERRLDAIEERLRP